MPEGEEHGESGSGASAPNDTGGDKTGKTSPPVDEGVKAYIDQKLSQILKGRSGSGGGTAAGGAMSPRQVEEHVAALVKEHAAALDKEKEHEKSHDELYQAIAEVLPKEKPKGSFISRFLWGE